MYMYIITVSAFQRIRDAAMARCEYVDMRAPHVSDADIDARRQEHTCHRDTLEENYVSQWSVKLSQHLLNL